MHQHNYGHMSQDHSQFHTLLWLVQRFFLNIIPNNHLKINQKFERQLGTQKMLKGKNERQKLCEYNKHI